jgi:hypothetical protein
MYADTQNHFEKNMQTFIDKLITNEFTDIAEAHKYFKQYLTNSGGKSTRKTTKQSTSGKTTNTKRVSKAHSIKEPTNNGKIIIPKQVQRKNTGKGKQS